MVIYFFFCFLHKYIKTTRYNIISRFGCTFCSWKLSYAHVQYDKYLPSVSGWLRNDDSSNLSGTAAFSGSCGSSPTGASGSSTLGFGKNVCSAIKSPSMSLSSLLEQEISTGRVVYGTTKTARVRCMRNQRIDKRNLMSSNATWLLILIAQWLNTGLWERWEYFGIWKFLFLHICILHFKPGNFFSRFATV